MIKITKTHDVWINKAETDPRDELLEELRVSLVEAGIVIATDSDFNNPDVETAMLRRRDFDINNGPLSCEAK